MCMTLALSDNNSTIIYSTQYWAYFFPNIDWSSWKLENAYWPFCRALLWISEFLNSRINFTILFWNGLLLSPNLRISQFARLFSCNQVSRIRRDSCKMIATQPGIRFTPVASKLRMSWIRKCRHTTSGIVLVGGAIRFWLSICIYLGTIRVM